MAHVGARVAPEEHELARRLLPEDAAAVFAAMPVADRRHALDVVGRLRATGHDSPTVLRAALLHDAAKGHRVRLWHRVAGVVLEAVATGLLHRLAVDDRTSWRHPFWLYLHHGELSADLAQRAGCAPATARLIRGTPDGEDEVRLLEALRAADDAS